jgi:hypothetical protein
MPKIDIPEVTARTTSDGAGHVHAVVTGSATGPQQALGELIARAQDEAARMAAGFREGNAGAPGPDVQWHFEVVGVRLVPGPLDSGPAGWTAYGTLTSKTATPW